MDRRAFLTTALAGGAALAFDHAAFAAMQIEAAATRSSPDSLKIDWQGGAGPATILLASSPYASPRALRPIATAPTGSVQVSAPVSPRPYFLVQARDGDVWTAERLLPLQGGRNFRDLGGYRGAGGKQVRWGRIYRSGVMNRLTSADMAYLAGLGVNTICDLRSVAERNAEPTPFLKAPGAKVAAFDYEMVTGLEGLARTKTKEEAVAAFADAYITFIDTLTPQYSDMFARLTRDEAPLTLNCSAGKDRTGVGSALILSVLGVPRDVVVADYALTQVYSPPSAYMQAMSSTAPVPGMSADQVQAMRAMPREVLLVLMGSDPEIMRQALAQIDAKFGGPVELVKTRFGLGEAGVARMRSLYLV